MLVLFAAALAIQVLYWLALGRGFARAAGDSQEDDAVVATSTPIEPVSVVVAARDEAPRIPVLLEALAAQTHPNFEVIVVDDASEDDTATLVEARAVEDQRFRLVRVTDPRPPRKKYALAAAIAVARHERLAFTDADCIPPATWLTTLAAYGGHQEEAVLVGYGPFFQRPGVLNTFIRYETLVTALFTAASIGLGRPYMAVGRNFSYTRSLFERIGGFEHQLGSLSGDDDLLVQQAHRHGAPVRYVADPAAHVPSEPAATWGQWARQKLRHTSAGRFYDRTVQVHLALFHVSNLVVWLAPAFLGWTGAGLLAIRFLIQRATLNRAAEALGEKDLMLPQPVLDVGYVLYNSLLAPAGTLRVPKRW
jgi:cellulose synthase/poly-beta-1,6-N-acetylglucosamine synthase-like glycosyltransferase